MGAAGLDQLATFAGTQPQSRDQVFQTGEQLLGDSQYGRHMNRSGNSVVAALPQIHIIIGMNLGAGIRAQVGNHLVHVHVGAGTGTGLENIHRELIQMVAVEQIITGADDGSLLVRRQLF